MGGCKPGSRNGKGLAWEIGGLEGTGSGKEGRGWASCVLDIRNSRIYLSLQPTHKAWGLCSIGDRRASLS